MSKNKLKVVVIKEVELDSNFKEKGAYATSAYLIADNGMSTWICSCDTKEELLEFINPEVIVENLEEILSQEEIHIYLDALASTPYCYDGKEYRAVFHPAN